MVADDEIIDYSVDFCLITINNIIVIIIRYWSKENHINQTKTEYNHSNDVSRYRSFYPESQIFSYCL